VADLEPFAREDLRTVLARFGVASARRALSTDRTEEVVLLLAGDFNRVDREALTQAVMESFPHTKVWIAPDGPEWRSEPI
jgi:hypothetical protein